MPEPLNIIQKLFAVQKAIEYVKKDSDTGVGGKGVARDYLVSQVRQILHDHGILVSTSQVEGSGSTVTASRKCSENGTYTDTFLYTGVYETSFINVDTPLDRHCVRHAGHGKDQSDKATGKASTYAEKLNILKALFLETGIADESRNPADREDPTAGLSDTEIADALAGINKAKTLEQLQLSLKEARKALVEKAGAYEGHPQWVTIMNAASKRKGSFKKADPEA